METWLLEYQTCMMPLCFFLIYYSSSCCCKNLVRDESKAEAQTLPFWCVLLLLFVIQWLVTPYFFPTLSSPSFLRLFLYSQKPPTLFEKLVALQRYFLLCSYTAAFAIKFLPCPGDVNEEFSSLGFWKFNPTVPISVPCLRCIYLYQYVLHMQCYAAKIDYKAVPKVVDCYFVVACLLQPYTELLVNHHAKTFTGGITCKREWSAIVRH